MPSRQPKPRPSQPSRRAAAGQPSSSRSPKPRRAAGWRIAVPVAVAGAGLLAATSAVNAHGTDLRPDGSVSLIQIVSAQRARVEALRGQAHRLQDEIDALSRGVAGHRSSQLQTRIDRLAAPVGLQALTGPALVVTLNDAPRGEPVPKGVDPNLLVVHQQDIQAVVNAMWAGGAEGISIQGQRIVSTTGIKCVGNTVVLQGVPYAPPYRIVAVGNASAMYDALLASPEVQAYRDYVAPPYNLGWALEARDQLTVPAYSGPLTLDYAQPLR